MASSSVSQDDHDVEQEFAIASRRAKVRSARANRAVNNNSSTSGAPSSSSLPTRIMGGIGGGFFIGEDEEELRGGGGGEMFILPENSPAATDASPKPLIRGLPLLNQKDKRGGIRVSHTGKSNKGARDRRKLREKRRSTTLGVMHLPSTESTGGSTGEDETEDGNLSGPPSATPNKQLPSNIFGDNQPEQIMLSTSSQNQGGFSGGKAMGKQESDLDADDEAENKGQQQQIIKDGTANNEILLLKLENQRLSQLLETKDRKIAMLEIQVNQLTKQLEELTNANK